MSMCILDNLEFRTTVTNLRSLVKELEYAEENTPNFKLNMAHYGGLDWLPRSKFNSVNVSDLSHLEFENGCSLGYSPFASDKNLAISEYDFTESASGSLVFSYMKYYARVFPSLGGSTLRFIFGHRWPNSISHFKTRVESSIESELCITQPQMDSVLDMMNF